MFVQFKNNSLTNTIYRVNLSLRLFSLFLSASVTKAQDQKKHTY